jgi:hypothetical protein
MLSTLFLPHTHTHTHKFREECKRFLQVILKPKQVTMMLMLLYGMLSTPKGYGQAWDPNTNVITPTVRGSNTGIGVNNPQRLLHLGNGSFTYNTDECTYIISNPAIRFSPTTNVLPNPLPVGYCPEGLTFVNWDIEASTTRLGFLEGTSERLTIRSGGKVGIGYTTPNFPLSFGTTIGNTTIALYENNNTDVYGLGIQGGQFRFHVANSTNRFSFLNAPNAPNGSELMNIFGDGRVGIGTINVSTGIKLQVNGGGIGQVTTGVIGNALGTWSTITEGSNINIPQNQFTFQLGNTQGTIYGLNSNRNHSLLSLGVLNDQNNGLSNPIIFSRGQSGRALLFGTLDANSNFREQMSLRNDGTLIVSGTPAQGLGSKLEAYGGNITQVSSGSPAGQTPTDIFTSIGGRLGNQPPPQAPGINAQGLRVQWGKNGANFGMTDFDDPLQTTIKNGLISWQDLTATNLGQVKNRLLIGFRDATSASGGSLPNFREVATFIADGKGILGVGTKTPASFISSGNNMSVGTTYGNIGAPLNGLIVEGRVGIGTPTPISDFSVPPITPQNVLGGNATGPIALQVAGGGILCNTYGVGSDSRIKRNVKPIESSLNLIKQLKGVNYEVNLTASTEKETWMPSSGFIAQEVKEVLPQVVMNLDNGYLALNYDAIIPVIVEALKEQNSIIEQQQAEITSLKNNGVATKRSEILEKNNVPTKNKLEQNIPNPFSGTTVIRYSWVEGNRASLMIFDLNGTTVHKVENLAKGDQELSLELSNLASGLYYYSLVVDGAESITKRMVLNK